MRVLSAAKYKRHYIKSIAGYHSKSSVKSYCGISTFIQCKTMSHGLHDHMHSVVVPQTAVLTVETLNRTPKDKADCPNYGGVCVKEVEIL